MKTISYAGSDYPEFQASGNAMRFALPFAKEVLGGLKFGYDVGCNRAEWAYPGAKMVDLEMGYNVDDIPGGRAADYIFSSHFLEHYLGSWWQLLDRWREEVLRMGGVIFLYLPDMSRQRYWAFGNKKHIHYLTPDILRDYCKVRELEHWVSGTDLNSSFVCVIKVS